MFKDITMGQYFPGNTVIHRLDPRTKLVLTLLYIIVLFVAKGIWSYAVMLAFLSVCVILSRIRLSVLLSGAKPIVFIIIITGILNLFYTKGEHLLIKVWRISVYLEGLQTAGFLILRILLLICCTLLLTYTTSPLQLTDAMESLLGPLKKLHFPVHELSMMMSIALRFIPTLIKETDKIMSAQKARGADFETGSLRQRAKALLPLLIPLFVSAFRRADELATAMESRCYHGGEGRTKMKQLRMTGADLAALASGAVLTAAVILLRRNI
ncbi:MAG: energy-coupling factor transporter transmembrane protein EcfT [Oscillospiraceae bacterium]|jgi:energy-coupling factor transport system permease protein|nr:energy-coupling factor transporter transmembrane protein EcfT [Oscillospiraceae bacterium]